MGSFWAGMLGAIPLFVMAGAATLSLRPYESGQDVALWASRRAAASGDDELAAPAAPQPAPLTESERRAGPHEFARIHGGGNSRERRVASMFSWALWLLVCAYLLVLQR
jgi:hypothetical protein